MFLVKHAFELKHGSGVGSVLLACKREERGALLELGLVRAEGERFCVLRLRLAFRAMRRFVLLALPRLVAEQRLKAALRVVLCCHHRGRVVF